MLRRPKHRRTGRHEQDGERWELYDERRAIKLVDAGDGLIHLLRRDVYDVENRGADGKYPALCGAPVLPAALAEAGARPCRPCHGRAIPAQRRR